MAGSCQSKVCDGAGAVLQQEDDTNVPNDGNDCTTDACNAGTRSSTPVALGTPCSGGTKVCHAAGTCVECNADADCKDPTKPSCMANQCAPVSCADGKKNGDETDVDCGGSCAPCPPGEACSVNADCASATCLSNVCAPDSCADGVLDGSETDVDCGGPCAPCAQGKACNVNADCASGSCAAPNGGPTTCQ